jgi:hypothetical protein
MKRSSFTMYEDISTDLAVKNLRNRTRSITVRTHQSLYSSNPVSSSTGGIVCMKSAVETARSVYVRNMSVRFGVLNDIGEDIKNLPSTVVHSAILNPLFPQKFMVDSTLLTSDQ